jgi:hypothetical protein
MQKEHHQIPYKLLISTLRDLCNMRKTGTMYISTDDNHAARFTLNNGEIVACGFSSRRGMEALELSRNINAGKYSFVESSNPAEANQNIPTTKEILKYLVALLVTSDTPAPVSISGQGSGQSPAFVDPFSTASASSQAKQQPTTYQDELNIEEEKQEVDLPNPDDLMELLQEELALYIGPLGPAVCSMHEEQIMQVRTPDDLSTVIEILSQELGSPEDAQKFKNEIWTRLA